MLYGPLGAKTWVGRSEIFFFFSPSLGRYFSVLNALKKKFSKKRLKSRP